MLNTLHHRYRHRQGFSIVELLIVIVVIAILAAITIVAFNGMQRRAQTAQYVSAADSVEKAIRAKLITDTRVSEYNLDYDWDSIDYSDLYICAAKEADLPATDEFEAGECMQWVLDGDKILSARADDAMYELLFTGGDATISPGVLPVGKMKSWHEGVPYEVKSRAIVVFRTANVPVWLMWVSPDRSSCGRYGEVEIGEGSSSRYMIDVLEKVLRGEMTPVEAGYPGDASSEELQQVLMQLKASGEWCGASLH